MNYLLIKQAFLISIVASTAFGMDSTSDPRPTDNAKIIKALIERSDYSVNLMWINKKLNQEQSYIYPEQDPNKLTKNLSNLFQWALKNPNSTVNFWFDSELTPPMAVKNTRDFLIRWAFENPQATPIALKDARDLPGVKSNSEVFSDKTPVYFRADLLRAMAATHTLSTGQTKHFVYADLDVEALNQEQLFDQETQEDLRKYGIVMADDGNLGFENGFQIIGHKKNLINAIEYALIQLNIKRALNALEGDFCNIHYSMPDGPMKPLEQIIYDSYASMLAYFYQLEGLGTLYVEQQKDRQPYSKELHGLVPFGLRYLNMERLNFETENKRLLSEAMNTNGTITNFAKPPTKKVNIPPPAWQYD